MLNVKTSETFLTPQSPASLTTVETSRSDKTASCTKLVRTPARETLSAPKQQRNGCVTNIVIRQIRDFMSATIVLSFNIWNTAKPCRRRNLGDLSIKCNKQQRCQN